MLFNSGAFVFGFLPVVLAGFFVLGRLGFYQWAVGWATLASLVFYGWDDPLRLLPLILASATFNFLVGRSLARRRDKRMLILGLAGNLLLLGYFKYLTLLVETYGWLTGQAVPDLAIALPIGISFYTFTQIAFLVDAYRGEAREYEPLKYGLFVTYFPHLVAGPILHHKEMMPQFDDPATFRPRLIFIAHGLAWFAVGLFKKVWIADSLAGYVETVFKAAAAGPVGILDAWVATVCYGLQIYFDFSGYSDMAVGLALMMGIVLPLNFNSPYKADSMIDFWRRWHMTLSRFLRDYLYIPLGGNRNGPLRRHLNLLITMVLGGLWHGATWNFAVWGAIHGVALMFNHLWRGVSARTGIVVPAAWGWLITMIVVTVAWVPFRADTLATTLTIWKAMLGMGAVRHSVLPGLNEAVRLAVVFALLARFAPNTQEILALRWSAVAAGLKWRPNAAWALGLGGLFGIAVAGMLSKPSVFLYFRF